MIFDSDGERARMSESMRSQLFEMRHHDIYDERQYRIESRQERATEMRIRDLVDILVYAIGALDDVCE